MINLSGYIFLALAIILGITANGFLKSTDGFANIEPTILCVISIVACRIGGSAYSFTNLIVFNTT